MASTVVAAALGERIRKLRESRGWSQRDLARRAGIASKSVISYYELGERHPTLENLVLLAKVFGVPTDYLLLGDDADKAPNVSTETRTDGDTYIRVRAGTLSSAQIDALVTLISGLQEK